MKIHFGVVDVSYSSETGGAETTHEVAMELEFEYGIYQKYIEARKSFIDANLSNAVANALLAKSQGLRVPNNILAEATDKIEHDFRAWLDAGGTGIVTMAAAMGIRHRNKEIESGQPRQSFIDTGLYQQSFRIWFEE